MADCRFVKINNIKKTAVVLAASLLVVLLNALTVFAGSINISTNVVEVGTGGSASVYLIGNQVAGYCSVSSGDEGICTASISGEGWVENGNTEIVISGVSEGQATVSVSYSVGDFEDEDALYEGTFEVNVTVSGASTGHVDYDDYQGMEEPLQADTVDVNTSAGTSDAPSDQAVNDGAANADSATAATGNVNANTNAVTNSSSSSAQKNAENTVATDENTLESEKTGMPVWLIVVISVAGTLAVVVGALYVLTLKKKATRRKRRCK